MIDVIIPVYDGMEETKRCIESVLDNKNLCEFNVLIIDDCSPNPAIKSYLQLLASDNRIELLVNDHNLGFVGTVNRGMSLHPYRDVLLLNSDAEVANDWLDRILAHSEADPRIATITPFSNNAEICSFPRYCKPNDIFSGKSTADIDAVFSRLPVRQIDVPTGVGFCMYIRRSALIDVGLFDEKTFGRGYGEENDFCMRAAARGWRNVTCSNVFVFHDGGVSFSTEKADRVRHAMAVLDQKHPSYHRQVHEHLQKDPERPFRVMAQLALLQQSEAMRCLFVVHRLGGGVIKHLEELSAHLCREVDFLFLRPADGNSVELGSQYGDYCWSLYFDMKSEYTLLLDILLALGIDRVHVHHVMGIPDRILKIPADLGLPYDVTLHDYYLVNANPTLTDRDGIFAENIADRDQLCAESYPVPDGLTVGQWREKYSVLLNKASRVFAPSRRCRDVYLDYFPGVEIEVAYHPDWENSHPFRQPYVPQLSLSSKLKVLVIGAMSREKGADVLERTATYRDPLDRLEYHLIGYAYRPLAPEVIQHGAYVDADLDRLIAELDPHLIWFPAQWHETYCYALSAALRSGLPILASDLGSFPERLAGRPMSFIKSWRSTPIEWNDTLLQIRDWLLAHQDADFEQEEWQQTSLDDCAFLYSRDYAQPIINRDKSKLLPDIERLTLLCYPHRADEAAVSLSSREKLLFVLVRLRELPGIHHVLRLVPFEWQRNIKRWFSHRPIHDIVNERR